MKFPALLTLLLAALLAALPTRQARAEDVSFDVFYTSLADDGDWYNTPDLGYVWHPNIADDANWRPYTDGYWAQTDDGWTWVSYESFGWAAYHYGRWTRLKDIGWAWVPGYEWGPGWVSWRTSDDYVGWAPLPPRAERVGNNGDGGSGTALSVDYNDVEAADDGYTPAVDQDYDIGPDNYCFVATPQFGAPVLARVLLPPQRNIVIFENSTNVTNIYYRRGPERTVVYNSGPDFAFISGRVERPIQRLRLERRDDVAYLRESVRGGGNPTVVRNGSLLVAAPLIARRPVNFEQVRPVRVKQTLAQPQVVHGWTNAGGDPKQVERLRERIRTQAQAAPRQARADLPPQNVAPAPVPEANPRPAAPGPGQEEAERVARRDAAQREKAARDKARNNPPNNPPATAGGQPFNGQNPGGENRGRSADERAARRTARDQAQEAEAARANNPSAGPTAAPAQDARRAARQAREQQGQAPQGVTPPTGSQPDAERAARRAERQQAQPPAQPAQPDQETRRVERQQQQPTQPAQTTQPDRRAERQQQAQQAQQQAQQAQQAQAQQERANRRAERQQAPQPAPAQGSDDDKKKKHDQ